MPLTRRGVGGRCGCGGGGCTILGCPIPEGPLHYSWPPGAGTPSGGTIELEWWTNSTWAGWYGVATINVQPVAGAGRVLQAGSSNCNGVCVGAADAHVLIRVGCDETFQCVVVQRSAITTCQYDPGTLVLPASGPPTLAPAVDWSGFPSCPPNSGYIYGPAVRNATNVALLSCDPPTLRFYFSGFFANIFGTATL